ncbi:glycosyltransferase family 2 protein [Paracoccus sp. TK19116]|uniref:Glycosyltransferase family 2 protein n=1 Tax=Paracoccus albicereus TaxID=2922394 RepID=A0ABT1MTK0_9RHOB|nr:glycosyltransferase family 2 protein [Paracoccus albicereus]
MPSSIAVIIVNYGTADLSAEAVESVLSADHRDHPVEVHLLDNASPGHDAETLSRIHRDRGWGERVTLWPERENHGFGRGNNVVLHALAKRDTPPDYVFLLNPDAALENEAIAILADRLDAEPDVAAVGASVTQPSGNPVSASFRFPTARSEFVVAMNFGPVERLFDDVRVSLPPDQPDGPVDWVTGAAVMFRLSDVMAVGGFDPDFFLYFEEVELMHRLTRAGHRILHVPKARVRHVEGAATEIGGGRPRVARRPAYWYRSWRLYHLKTRGRRGAIGAGLAAFTGALLNVPVAVLRRNPMLAPKGYYADFPKMVLWPLLTGRDRS